MLPEYTNVTERHVKALLARDILKKYPSAPVQWLALATDVNMKRIQCLYFGKCKGVGLRTDRKCCMKKRRCFRPCS